MAHVVKHEFADPIAVRSRILALCQEKTEGITQEDVFAVLPGIDSSRIAEAFNDLLSQNQLTVLKLKNGGCAFKVNGGDSREFDGLTTVEKVIYQTIKDSGNQGSTSDYEAVERLIMAVKQNIVLIDKTHPDHSDSDLREGIWASIGERLNFTGEEAKKKWKNVRDTYVRRKRSEARNFNCRRGKSWKYDHLLGFLDRYLDPKIFKPLTDTRFSIGAFCATPYQSVVSDDGPNNEDDDNTILDPPDSDAEDKEGEEGREAEDDDDATISGGSNQAAPPVKRMCIYPDSEFFSGDSDPSKQNSMSAAGFETVVQDHMVQGQDSSQKYSLDPSQGRRSLLLYDSSMRPYVTQRQCLQKLETVQTDGSRQMRAGLEVVPQLSETRSACASGSHRCTSPCTADPDEMFLRSLLPDVKKLKESDKFIFKMKVQKLLFQMRFPEASASPSTDSV